MCATSSTSRCAASCGPGVTGWAQINQGYAHEADEMRSKLEYDLYYLKHCSLWLDLVIVLRTFAVVFRGTGAR